MVKYSQIIDAINLKIKDKFPTIKMQATDDNEGLIRPSFRTTIDSQKTSNFMGVARDRDMTIRLYYFPTNLKKYKLEMLDIKDGLEEIFVDDNIITLDDGFKIQLFDDMDTDIIDGVMHFTFKISISELIDKVVEGELMEDINLETEIESEE